MTISTKYSIGQEIWLLYDNKAVKQEINSLYTTTERKGGEVITTILYDIVFCSGGYKESDLFETKEELLQSL